MGPGDANVRRSEAACSNARKRNVRRKAPVGEYASTERLAKSVGISKDDPGFAEMIQLGREIRQQEQEDGS